MPAVHPFRAVQYLGGKGDASQLVAPPYDVLDASSKARLLSQNPKNIVAIDLPHTPAKELGPPAAYERAATDYRAWLGDGTLSRSARPAMYAYRQTFKGADGATVQRRGLTCCIDCQPFGPRAGGGVLPHEETFSGPKEDRFALMKSTRVQLSPIFGLYADERGLGTALLERVMTRGPANLTATTSEGVLHEVWTIDDDATINACRDALAGEDVFIADGHHRYTTQLNYIKNLESQGAVAPDHPARRCMIVLVGMSDPGLVIWPTHRVLGGMKDYSYDRFVAGAAKTLRFEPIAGGAADVGRAVESLAAMGESRFGIYDFREKRGAVVVPATADPLGARFPKKPRAWRDLTVAFVQHAIVEEICQPLLNGGAPVKWAFPHTIAEVEEIGRGAETGAGGGGAFTPQLAIIVRPTPLGAVRDVSRANELMPQKSTFFYPKLATGLFVNPLEG
jgi:uncharacterized protein (DUF1015 family)